MSKRKKKYTRYTEGKLRLRNIRFWVIYLVLVALLVFAGTRVYRYFDTSLTAYEEAASKSQKIVDEVSAIFTEKHFDQLYAYEDSSLDYMETKEDYVAYLNRLTENAEIDCTLVRSEQPDEQTYSVTADGKSFATFVLKKSGESEFEILPMFGFTLRAEEYELKSIQTSILQLAAYEVTARDSDTVYVNGKALTAKQAISTGAKLFYDGHLPEGYPSPTLTTYRFTCALGEPEIRVVDASGSECELTKESDYTYSYQFQYADETMKPQFEANVLECAKDICLYTTNNQTQARVLKRMETGSKAAEAIKNIDAKWLTKADKKSFENERTENYAMFGESIFCCDVHFDYNTVSRGVENSYPTSYRLYFKLVDGAWLIYDFENL